MPGESHSWYKDAVIYLLPVAAFFDSNDDGIGDFRGLTEKLEYLQDLGITAIWLLPFYPSPLADGGYDVSDYTNVHPSYGTLDDFGAFLAAAHARGLRVIAEMVLNHTSDRHPWFQRSRRAAAGSPARNFYVWSDTTAGLAACQALPAAGEMSHWTWDAAAGAYYWHSFSSQEPDLNYDNPQVQAAMLEVMDFWFDQGVDGLGLAAVPYLFKREASCENLPETHAFLAAMRAHVDRRYPAGDRVLLAEANQWPQEAAAYFGDGRACHMAVHFAATPRLFMSVRMEDSFPIVDILRQTPAIPPACQWATFLRNQDELALEMVTDEERDYLCRTLTRAPREHTPGGILMRLAPLLGNDRRQIELLNGLLFALPGTPVLYYGDEIGMGSNVFLGGRRAMRMPMQWNTDRNAGFSRANPQQLYVPLVEQAEYHFATVNVETQQANSSSLLRWTKRLIALRRWLPALARGSLAFLPTESRKVLAFVRRCRPDQVEGEEVILVVANLSRFAEYVALDLSEFDGQTPVEVAGRRSFPPVGRAPYLITLAPYQFYWFALEAGQGAGSPSRAETAGAEHEVLPTLTLAGSWQDLLADEGRAALEAALPGYLRPRRWFRGKARNIKAVSVLDAVPVPLAPSEPAAAAALTVSPGSENTAYVVPLRVDYDEGDAEVYVLPMARALAEDAIRLHEQTPQAVIARLAGGGDGLLYDAMWAPAFSTALLSAIAGGRRFPGRYGALSAEPTSAFGRVVGPPGPALPPRVGRAEQSNTSVAFGERLILKLLRRIEEGINPDLEVTRFLTEETDFAHSPPVAGSLTYRAHAVAAGRGSRLGAAEPVPLGILQGFVPNQGDAWAYTLDHLGHFVTKVQAQPALPPPIEVSTPVLLELAGAQPPELARLLMGDYLDAAALLGTRTAEMHLALASRADLPDFAPEPFTLRYQRSLYQSMRGLADPTFALLRRLRDDLPPGVRDEARKLAGLQDEILARFHAITDHPVHAMRMRTHGDYHLGQVLYTGSDFVIIDFEGEPGRPLSERRFKRGALRDVAGMLRSFQYAAYGRTLFDDGPGQAPGPAGGAAERRGRLDAWARYWQVWACAAFLRTYLDAAARDAFLPSDRGELGVLLEAYLLEKAVYELGYELNNRPDWVTIPIRSILQLLRS